MSSVASAWRDRLTGHDHPYGVRGDVVSASARMLRSTTFQAVVRLAGVKPPASVLEAGIGSGKFSLAFALAGYCVTALDCVPTVLTDARRNTGLLGHAVCRRTRFVCGDLEQAPLRPASFDAVFNEGVIEHWLDAHARRQVIAAMAHLARPGGVVCVIVPNGGHPRHEWWMANHYPGYASAPPMTPYDWQSLGDDLAAAGLDTISVDGLGAWQSFNLWPHRPARRLPLGVLDRCLPGPRRFRLRRGQSLIAVGSVSSGASSRTSCRVR